MDKVTECLDALIEEMRESRAYQNYLWMEEELEKAPDLKSRVDGYRIRNYRLQQSENVDLYDAVDSLERDSYALRKSEKANAYLEAELEVPYNNKDKDIESQIKDETSLLNLIKALNKLRDTNEDLTKHDGFELLDKPLSYRRGKTLIAMNLKDEPMEIDLKPGLLELSIGSIEVKENKIILPKHAAIVYKER